MRGAPAGDPPGPAIPGLDQPPVRDRQPVDKIPPAFLRNNTARRGAFRPCGVAARGHGRFELRCIRSGRFAQPYRNVKTSLLLSCMVYIYRPQGCALRCSSAQ